MIRSRRSGANRWLPALLMVALLLTACMEEGNGGGTDTGTERGDAGYPNWPRIQLTVEEQAGYDALMADLLGPDGVSGRLATHAAEVLSALSPGLLQTPVASVTAYEAAPQPSACGLLSTENAWYCAQDDSIYYDDNFFRTLYRHLGMAGPTIILAHEWGHHMQTMLHDDLLSIQAELQADCFAGMFFGRAMQPPPGEQDLRSAGATLFIIGDKDYRASQWFKPDIHGPASWRAKAFLDGALAEGAYCRDYAVWSERGTVAIGPYRWLPAPAIEFTQRQDQVVVASLRGRTAYVAGYPAADTAVSALEYIPTVFANWFTSPATAIGAPLDIPTGEGVGGILGGTGAVQAYQYVEADGSTHHGLLFVHVATTGDVGVVSVTEPGPAPASEITDPAWNPISNYLFVVAFSLCPPDGAGALCVALGGE